MLPALFIALGVAIELYAVIRASRRGEHLSLAIVIVGVACFSFGMILSVLAAGGLS